MNYIKKLKLYITVFALIMLVPISIFLLIEEAAPINYFASILLFIPILILIKVYFNTKLFYNKIFDYDFYDLHNELGVYHEVASGYSLTIENIKLLFFSGPSLYLYQNSMIVQIGDRAMYIDDLSKVKIYASYIKFNYKGIDCNISFRYFIPSNVKTILQNCKNN